MAFFWLRVSVVVATPLAFVTAEIVWAPTTKTIVRPSSRVPVASRSRPGRVGEDRRQADRLVPAALSGAPLSAPVYVTVVAIPDEFVAAEPAPAPFTVNAMALPLRPTTYSSTSDTLRLVAVS